MKPAREAKKYAKMLINAVGVEGAPQALTELSLVETMMAKSREFRSVLVSPVFSLSEKEAAFGQVASRLKFSDTVVKFVKYLMETGVIAVLSEIVKAATAIYLEKKKRARATVFSPIAVSKAGEERLKAALKGIVQRDVDVDVVIDPALLGGVLVKVGSTMYDSSIKGQLRILKDELIKG